MLMLGDLSEVIHLKCGIYSFNEDFFFLLSLMHPVLLQVVGIEQKTRYKYPYPHGVYISNGKRQIIGIFVI